MTRGWFVSQRTTKYVFSFQLSFVEAPYIQPDFSRRTLNERDGPLHVIGLFRIYYRCKPMGKCENTDVRAASLRMFHLLDKVHV